MILLFANQVVILPICPSSSAGRASPLQEEGRQFDSVLGHASFGFTFRVKTISLVKTKNSDRAATLTARVWFIFKTALEGKESIVGRPHVILGCSSVWLER